MEGNPSISLQYFHRFEVFHRLAFGYNCILYSLGNQELDIEGLRIGDWVWGLVIKYWGLRIEDRGFGSGIGILDWDWGTKIFHFDVNDEICIIHVKV